MRLLPALLFALALAGCYATPARHRGATWTATVERVGAKPITYRVMEVGEDYAGELVIDGKTYTVQEAHHRAGVFTGFALIGETMLEIRLEHVDDGTDDVSEWVDAMDRVQLQKLRFRKE